MRPIDDTIRGDNVFAVIAALAAPEHERVARMACCPHDGEPLMSTMERAGAEFLCMACGQWFGFLAPIGADETPVLLERHAELRAQFDAGVRP